MEKQLKRVHSDFGRNTVDLQQIQHQKLCLEVLENFFTCETRDSSKLMRKLSCYQISLYMWMLFFRETVSFSPALHNKLFLYWLQAWSLQLLSQLLKKTFATHQNLKTRSFRANRISKRSYYNASICESSKVLKSFFLGRSHVLNKKCFQRVMFLLIVFWKNVIWYIFKCLFEKNDCEMKLFRKTPFSESGFLQLVRFWIRFIQHFGKCRVSLLLNTKFFTTMQMVSYLDKQERTIFYCHFPKST